MTESTPRQASPAAKILIEVGPLLVFFLTNARVGIYAATAAFMAAIVLSLATSWVLERRLPTMPLVTAGFVLVFGTLTLVLADELFIKLKPTVVNVLFAAILFGGLARGRALLRPLLESSVKLDERGWRTLTARWASFFVFLAIANEVVWRNTSTDTWVSFKVFGILPLTLVFTMTQLPLIRRHELGEEEAGAPATDTD
ncbi:MAG: septation protein A [Planctomycetota bacterium]|jgi:intracellular septation protein|nr:septation protein A [Planctomycetota bacterium]MDP6763789.1 septation protein A [Planctomycetota bacterium]MDP6989001.1 septation protein A [Planctomycetota bacterium]